MKDVKVGQEMLENLRLAVGNNQIVYMDVRVPPSFLLIGGQVSSQFKNLFLSFTRVLISLQLCNRIRDLLKEEKVE